ncbi:MAG TPA: hypothetical protein VGJ64_04285 [Gemmatimonadaceae bacterium]|jgi:hypothetical protein
MQDPQVISILEIIAPSVLGVVFIIAVATVVNSWIGNRAKRLTSGDPAAQARIEERLNHLANAVDAIAVEVERISEGQRFTTKLFADSAAAGTVDQKALPSEVRR